MSEMNFIDLSEMTKLIIGLDMRGIPFTVRSLYDGMQILCDGWDAICHKGSYGHESGLIEVMGAPVCQSDCDDVEGWLTAQDILDRL